jgi:hypothetical protein
MSPPRRDDRSRLSRPTVPGELVDPVPVGDAAARVGAELGLSEPRVFSRLVEAWPEIVGPVVAAHSRIRAVRHGVVEVVVDSPAWSTEFRYLERDLVERASAVVGAGAVTGVRAFVGGRSGPPPEADPTGR